MSNYWVKVSGLLLVPVIALILVALTGAAFANIYPNEAYENWMYDLDENRIDDRLEEMAPGDTVDAVVLFNHCLTPEDSTFVAGYAEIEYVGEYVQAIFVKDALVSELMDMLYDPHGDEYIFRIELATEGQFDLDVSCPAVKARPSATYSPNTAWDFGATASGVAIAILDTGVDDGHPAFTNKYVGGFDATNPGAGNPDDLNSEFHGTHVAGIALGNDPNGTYMGVARDAKLVDVKVGTNSVRMADHARAINWCIGLKDSLNIGVLNMSYSMDLNNDGKSAACMYANRAVDAGLVVCASVGNRATNAIPSPAAADGAIAVGALYDSSTVVRNDDVPAASFTNYGPRISDGDTDTFDEMKPEVVAPGDSIISAKGDSVYQYPPNNYHILSGTSMACPHVAGIAAILLQSRPELWTAGPAFVKVYMTLTATDRNQNPNPPYNGIMGHGEVDAFGAVTCKYFPATLIDASIKDGGVHQGHPGGKSGDLVDVTAEVFNNGTDEATDAVVQFFANRNNLGFGGWIPIGRTTVDIPPGDSVLAAVSWIQLEDHNAVRAIVTCCGDTTFRNNQGQSSVDIGTGSFSAEAGTPFTGYQLYELKVDPSDLLTHDGWTAKIWSEDDLFDTLFIDTDVDTSVFFEIEDSFCPRMIRAEVSHPPEAAEEDTAQLVLSGYVDTLKVGEQVFRTYVATSGVEELRDGPAPDVLTLYQNQPNPFRSSTAIKYGLPATGRVRIAIYDLRGRKIRSLVDERQTAGRKMVSWDGRTDEGTDASPGLYFCRITAGDRVVTNKMVLAR